MTKTLTRLALAALAAALCAPVTAAQALPTPAAQVAPAQTPSKAPPEWVAVAPAGEAFTARMPKQPAATEQRVQVDGLNASGLRYAVAADDETTFAVWVMKGSHGTTRLDAEHTRSDLPAFRTQLDAVAELAWEVLVAREVKRLKGGRSWLKRLDEVEAGMRYTRDFALSGRSAREYQIWVEKARGAVYVVADESGAYVVAALGPGAGELAPRQFLDSFTLPQEAPPTSGLGGMDLLPGAGVGTGSGAGAGTVQYGGMGGGGIDYNRPFRQVEVKNKARLTRKPEPGFTEAARKFNVTGVVRLRAILHSSGEVRNISVVKSLPHGLTEKSVAAARQIRFEPAQKDGRVVSQYVVLDYNFNIY